MKNEILLIILLSWFDALFTDLGIRYFMIEEANPLMAFLYNKSIFLFYGTKLVLPLLFLTIILRVTRINDIWYIRYLMKITACIYLGILAFHAFWFALVTMY